MQAQPDFPFKLPDIESWIVKRKDGTAVRYTMKDALAGKATSSDTVASSLPAHYAKGQQYSLGGSVSAFCKHDPTPLPVFSHKPKAGGQVDLYIADSFGARSHQGEFDVLIDGGSVIPVSRADPKLEGDYPMTNDLQRFVRQEKTANKLIHLDWDDRQAPPVYVEFWPALVVKLEAEAAALKRPLKVLTICQGGHGRSGSSLTILMMLWSDYSPLDAITHLRAIHCPRAIESKVQHEYLNAVGKMLGRPENAHDAEQVKSFKDRFLNEVTSSFAAPYQRRLKGIKES